MNKQIQFIRQHCPFGMDRLMNALCSSRLPDSALHTIYFAVSRSFDEGLKRTMFAEEGNGVTVRISQSTP